MINFTFQVAPISDPRPDQIRQIIGLYRNAGWWTDGDDNQDLAVRIISGSHCFMIATKADEIIGMGRAISDGASDAYIQDVTVKNDYRQQGIGSRIVKALLERLHSDGLSWIGLIAEGNSHPFYERLGFQKMPDSIPLLKTDQ